MLVVPPPLSHDVQQMKERVDITSSETNLATVLSAKVDSPTAATLAGGAPEESSLGRFLKRKRKQAINHISFISIQCGMHPSHTLSLEVEKMCMYMQQHGVQ